MRSADLDLDGCDGFTLTIPDLLPRNPHSKIFEGQERSGARLHAAAHPPRADGP